MKNIFASTFADLVRVHEKSSADEVLAIFIKRFGPSWATDVTQYVAEDVIKKNRPEYHKFYFDQSVPISGRSDPRSGMFCRNPMREGGKIEILLHLALGLEGFAQLLKVPRVIDGVQMSVTVANKQLNIDKVPFQTDFEKVIKNLSEPSIRWDDNILLPSFEDALIKAKQVILKLVSATSYDEEAFFDLGNVMLCGGHCQGCKTGIGTEINMAKIMAVGGAMRGAAQMLSNSIRLGDEENTALSLVA